MARHLPSGESLTESGQVVVAWLCFNAYSLAHLRLLDSEATLMHVADVLALCRGVGKATICASDDFQQHHQLAKNYLQESFAEARDSYDLSISRAFFFFISANRATLGAWSEVRAPEIDVEKQGSNAMSLVLGEGESIWNSIPDQISELSSMQHANVCSNMRDGSQLSQPR